MRESRIRTILNLLKDRNYVSHQELADVLHVSLSTVRRDLHELQSRNQVVLSRNGVVPVSESVMDTPIDFRSRMNARAKSHIAGEAIRLISNGNTVFLDSSSTVLSMADGLRSIHNLVIVTNSLFIATRIYNADSAVYLLGGEMSRPSHGFFGGATIHALQNFNIDIAFLSPVAVTPSGYAAQTTEESAELRRAVMRHSQRNVLLFDHSKIGLVRPFNIAPLREFDHIITDDRSHSFDTHAVIHRVDAT